MKAGEPEERHPRLSWRKLAFTDVLINGAECVREASANAATVDGAVPLRIVLTHTVSSKGRRATKKCKKMMVIRSIEIGLACNHPNWICCGGFNADKHLMGEACATAQQMFGLARVPTISGDVVRGGDFFISPRGFRSALVIDTSDYADKAHNAILVRVPMLWPCRSYKRGEVEPFGFRPLICPAPKTQAQEGSRKRNLSDSA